MHWRQGRERPLAAKRSCELRLKARAAKLLASPSLRRDVEGCGATEVRQSDRSGQRAPQLNAGVLIASGTAPCVIGSVRHATERKALRLGDSTCDRLAGVAVAIEAALSVDDVVGADAHRHARGTGRHKTQPHTAAKVTVRALARQVGDFCDLIAGQRDARRTRTTSADGCAGDDAAACAFLNVFRNRDGSLRFLWQLQTCLVEELQCQRCAGIDHAFDARKAGHGWPKIRRGRDVCRHDPFVNTPSDVLSIIDEIGRSRMR